MVVTGCVVGTVTVMVVDLVTVVDAVVVAVEVTVVAVLVGVVVGGYVVVVGDQLQVNNGGPVSKRRTMLQNVHILGDGGSKDGHRRNHVERGEASKHLED